jgi:hypothetical protein
MAITIPYTFVPDTDILSAEVNQNFSDIATKALDKTGDTLTGNVACSGGVTIDGVDISAVIGSGGTLLAVNGSAVTALNASNLASGTVATARLGSGTANSSTYLRGDSTWASITSSTPTVLTKTANYTVSTGDGTTVVVLCTNTITITLYAASGNTGNIVHVKNNGTGTITVDANASETIDGALTQTLSAQYVNLTLVCTGTGWAIL